MSECCAICLDAMESGQAVTTVCAHTFHESCIQTLCARGERRGAGEADGLGYGLAVVDAVALLNQHPVGHAFGVGQLVDLCHVGAGHGGGHAQRDPRRRAGRDAAALGAAGFGDDTSRGSLQLVEDEEMLHGLGGGAGGLGQHDGAAEVGHLAAGVDHPAQLVLLVEVHRRFLAI